MSDVLHRLLTYNLEANRRYIDILRHSPPAAERVGSIFSHILNAHRIWNCRLGAIAAPVGVWDLHVPEQWDDLNRRNFADSTSLLESRALDQIIDYKDTKGNPHQSTIEDILLHVVNHSTYHRGQLAILLGQETKQPPVTDFIAWARETGV